MADTPLATPEQVTVSVVGTSGAPATRSTPAVEGVVSGTVARTSAGQPNLLVNVVTPAVAIAVRAANAWLTTFAGLLTAAGIGVGSGAIGADFGTVLYGSAISAAVVAGLETIKNLITIFGKLENKYPLATGSI